MSARSDVLRIELGDRSHPVVVGRGFLGTAFDEIGLPQGAGKAMVVTQQPVVDAGHVEPIEDALRRGKVHVERVVVPEDESAKAPEVLLDLWRHAARLPLLRTDVVVAVGGGVVGDLAGFLGATYNRGVRVIQVPTTLLAQVDAGIGGKTGINLPEGKNLVGAFHQPIAVLCDVATLDTLPRRIFVEGFAEIIKYGLIRDPGILEILEGIGPNAPLDPGAVQELVLRSVAVKAEAVSADEREEGVRAFLNFGHTYAHVLETLAGYGEVLHGEAVAIGMIVALHLGHRIGHTPEEVVARGEAIIDQLGLPMRGPRLDGSDVQTVMGRDKKATGEGVRFVVLDEVGSAAVVAPQPDDVFATLQGLDALS